MPLSFPRKRESISLATKRHKRFTTNKHDFFTAGDAEAEGCFDRSLDFATGPSTSLRAILPAIEVGKIGFVWVRFDKVSIVHFSL
jgi:hypothetical protein